MKTINFKFENKGICCSGTGDFFEKSDINSLAEVYFSWKKLNKIYTDFNVRRGTFPELLSEGLASAIFGWVRTNATSLKGLSSSSCDLVDITSGDTIQLKACSTDSLHNAGPTSFGPRTEFDRLVFMHMNCETDIASFYELNENDYKTWKVNKEQTIEDQ